MYGRLGAGGKKLKLDEVARVMGVSRQAIQQMQSKVQRRDKKGLIPKFKIQFPFRIQFECGKLRHIGKMLLLKWIQDSGSAYCPKCRAVKVPDEMSPNNAYCRLCQHQRSAKYKSEHREHLRKLNRGYANAGYVPYRDKLIIKKES